ncbi:hypothetical protein Sjap_006069 [Stephania japonica]|uniref:Uncharacterized protein n=1 Tax=Stephania japonica TaxID=461633 RepID=A0AAP0K5C6_9MAGN
MLLATSGVIAVISHPYNIRSLPNQYLYTGFGEPSSRIFSGHGNVPNRKPSNSNPSITGITVDLHNRKFVSSSLIVTNWLREFPNGPLEGPMLDPRISSDEIGYFGRTEEEPTSPRPDA